ncbi:putative nucleotide-binding alpha-beta plait domain-containing protein [Rosa chinensis]|uniref:Putative nucleotide-binding alpha-beta plait domain-containing protein n=1 Tax=Rosa chinensis TaxID=74649 RepID=A0A2P6RLZ2_ROSCH|nr:putative nucleotide-binding alpha-beta plait domain-containing protein [Rosa chinensis]
MKTRNAGVPKPSTTAKKTPPARKSASKAQPSPSVETPKTVETKRTSARAAMQVKKTETAPVTASKRRQSSAEDSAGGAKGTLGTKVGVGTSPIGRRTSGRAKAPASVYVSAQAQSAKAKGNASNKKKKVDIKDVEFTEEEVMAEFDGKPAGLEETAVGEEVPAVENVGVSATDEKGAVRVELDPSEDEEDPIEMEESVVKEVAKSSENVPRCDEGDPVEVEESVIEEVAKSSECVPLCDEEDPVEKEESVVGEAARSSENEPPCDKENPVAIEESVIEEIARSSGNQPACDIRQSVVEEVARNSENEPPCAEEDPTEIEESAIEVVTKSSENRLPCDVRERVEVKAEQKAESKDNDSNEETSFEPANKLQNDKARLQGEDTDLPKEMYAVDEEMEYGEKIDLGEHGEEELPADDAEDHEEETETLEDERQQLTAIAKERKIKKEREVFLDGLDPDVEEEDVRRVFERIGGIVEVRLQKNPSTNKNKGYAYVEFKDKEHVRRALSEMKNPAIRGKRCGTAPSEDNTTLFIGNICNTWTKEAIKQKLKDYEVEGIENINLVPDIRREGLSRGFAFVEFSCHGDAMLAYKRLQQSDVIFGHPERTAKVAFAEPICEPDPEVMAQVKSIFVDGLPPHWDEKQVREQFKCYGEILRVVLARNMSTAKRKDFGFVDFSSHESAVACVNVVNNTPLSDGHLKIKVKARLSNPLPKTQAVKGGIRGGFRIGHGGSGVSRFGRDFGRSGHTSNRANFQHDRHVYDGGRGQTARMGFNQHNYDYPYAEFRGRGGRRGFFRGGQFSSGGGSGVASPSPRPYVDRSSHGAPDRGRGMPAPFRRHPYSPEGHFDGPHMRGHFDGPHMGGHFDGPHMGGHFGGPHIGGHFGGPHIGGHFDEPSFYDERDRTQGIKRPFHMRDYDPDYLEPSRHRPRLNYNDPTASFRGNHYSDTYGAGSSLYPHEYYGPESHYGPHSSYYGRNQSYGGGRYY